MTSFNAPVLRYEMDHEGDLSQLVYTFGGAEARAAVFPGSVIDTSTLDCFAGAIHSVHDHVSEVCDPRYLNPQTGPFYVEGAMPGDVLAVHFARIEPRNTKGFSTTVPLFGALTANGFTQSFGQDGSIMVLQLAYQLPLPSGPMFSFASLSNGTRLIVATQVFINE